MANVATAEILLRLNTSEYDRQFQQARQQLGSLSAKEYGISINNRDADLALQTTLGLVNRITGTLKGFGQQAVGEFRAFSGALQGTAAISGATQEELAALKDEAIKLGIATTKSPTQVANAATAYTRLGFSATQATKDLAGLVQLSESTGSSLESSAQVAATALKLFEDSVTSLQAANIITATLNNTAAGSVDEFNQILSKAGGIAKSNGVSFEELAATFGLLRTTGSSAEVAATAVKNSLLQLTVPSEKGKAALAKLGVQARDGEGKFVGLRNVLEQLRGTLQGVDDQTRDQALSDIFGRFAGPAITSLLSLNPEEFGRVFDTIAASSEGAGAAAETAEKRLQGLNKTLTLLTGTTQTVKATIGEQLAPILNVTAGSTLNLLNAFLGLPPALQTIVVGAGTAVAAFGTVVISLSAARSAIEANTLATVGLSAAQLKQTAITIADTVAAKAYGLAQLSNINLIKAIKAALVALTTAQGLNTVVTKAQTIALGIQELATKGLAVAKEVLALATGKATTAEVSQTAAVAAGAVTAGLFVLAIGAVIENLKILGVIGNEATKKVNEFRKAVREAQKEDKPIVDVDELKASLGPLDQFRFQVGRLFNAIAGGRLTEEELIKKTTVAGLEETRALGATIAVRGKLLDIILESAPAIKATNEALKEQGAIEGLSNEEKIKQIKLLEAELAEKQKIISAAEASGLAVEGQIEVLQGQSAVIEESIALLKGQAVATQEQAIANEILTEETKKLEDAQSKANDEIDLALAKTKALTAERQLAGEITESQAIAEVAKAEQQALQDRLEANKAFFEELQKQAEDIDLLSPEDAADLQKQLFAAEQEGFDLRLELAKNQLAEQKRISDEALNEIETSSKERIDLAVEASNQARKAALESQLKGVTDAKTAQQAIREAETQAINERIASLQQKRQELEAAQEINTEKRKEEISKVTSEILGLEIDLIERQIAEEERLTAERQRQAEIRLESQRLVNNLIIQELESEKQAFAFQQDLTAAKLGLFNAQTDLYVQRLKFAKDESLTQEQAFAISKQIFTAEKNATLAKLEVEKQSLNIKISQQRIENEIAQAKAAIAVIEAQAAIEAAKARGASEEELANLNKVLQLKQQIAGQTALNATQQEELFKIQQDTLAVQQETVREQLANEESALNKQTQLSLLNSPTLTEKQKEQLAAEQTKANAIIQQLSTQRKPDEGAQAELIARTAIDNRGNSALLEQLQQAGGFVAEIAGLVQALKEENVTNKEASKIKQALDGENAQQVVSLLQQLVNAVKEGGRPNINVSTATPLADTLELLRNTR